MARSPRKTSKKTAKKGRRTTRRRIPLKYNAKKVGGPNTARVVQTLPSQYLNVNTPYIFKVGGITGDRALAHAEQYGLYRIAKIEFKHKPLYDTFRPDAWAGTPPANFITGVPELYWKMNRYADEPAAFSLTDLQSLGAKPHRLDDKTYTLSYKPNILLANESAGSISGTVKMTPWLNTDDAPDTGNFAPSTTEHYGHFLYIEANCVNDSTDPAVCELDVIIHYEFKTPRTEWTPAGQGGKVAINPFKLVDISGNSV